MTNDQTKNTACVHAGEEKDPLTGSVTVPIYQTSTFGFNTIQAQNKAVKNRKKYLYTRWSNPTTAAVAKKVAKLEKTDDSLVLASGMAAITTTMLGLLQQGDRICAIEDCYGGTLSLFNKILPKFGITVDYFKSLAQLQVKITSDTKLVYVESPTNPLVGIVDLERVSKIAHDHNCFAICDNTFATPINQNPSNYNYDLIVHSATKYLGGHSDLIAGVITGRQELIDEIWSPMITLGGTLNANTAWLLLRGLKTLDIRVRQHNRNALKLAEYLEKHPKVKTVYYPGLESHPQHQLAKKQMKQGFGGMLSFELNASLAETSTFLENLEIITLAPSLGGIESLITQPAAVTHSYLSKDEREKIGIYDSLVRLSVGIEDIQDLISDLAQAFQLLN